MKGGGSKSPKGGGSESIVKEKRQHRTWETLFRTPILEEESGNPGRSE